VTQWQGFFFDEPGGVCTALGVLLKKIGVAKSTKQGEEERITG
jgi:hypothetical protein